MVVDRLRTGRRVYANRGPTGTVRAALEFAISRPRLHPKFHWWLARRYYERRCANDVGAAAAPTDPFKLEWISPDRIERHTRREYPPYRDRLRSFGAVRDGDWDRRDEPPVDPDYDGPPAELFLAERFEESILFRSLAARFERDVPWEETELVRRARRLLPASTPERVWHECTTAAEIDERCRRLDALYETIRTDGYRAERERFGTDRGVGFRHCLRQEITVDVGREGELLLVCGKHRLAIAKLLGLERVPVVFLVRHPEWMRHRVAVADGADHDPHPDLRDLA